MNNLKKNNCYIITNDDSLAMDKILLIVKTNETDA